MTREEQLEAAIKKAVEMLGEASAKTQVTYENYLRENNKEEDYSMRYPFRYGALESEINYIATILKQSL